MFICSSSAPFFRLRTRIEDERSNQKPMQQADYQEILSETLNKLPSLQNRQQTTRVVSSVACMCNEQLSCPKQEE